MFAGTLGDGVGTWRNAYSIAMDRGNSVYDRSHGLVGTLIYDLPFGRGARWGSGWSPVANTVLGGWRLSGIDTVRTARHFSVTVTGNPGNISGTNYANCLSEGNLPNG